MSASNTDLYAYKRAETARIKAQYDAKVIATTKAYSYAIGRYNKGMNAKTERDNKIELLQTENDATISFINNLQITPWIPVDVRNNRNKAILIGINYFNTELELKGTFNDVLMIKNILTTRYFYQESNITLMNDTVGILASKSNILAQFTQMLSQSVAGDHLVFFYSGHGDYAGENGAQRRFDFSQGNIKKGEVSAVPAVYEAIIPLDSVSEGTTNINKTNLITDIELKEIIDANLKPGVHLVAIFDSCYSGTIMNLPNNYLQSENSTEVYNNIVTQKSAMSGNVVVISGSTSIGLSYDDVLSGKAEGALTWCINEILNSTNGKCSWRQMLTDIQTLLIARSFPQTPQLSFLNPLNIQSRIRL